VTRPSLSQLLGQQPKFFEGKRVSQIVSFCGDGKLLDDSETSTEFRDFLTRLPISDLKRYAADCLEASFDGGGFVLQDIINEVGVRLGYRVSWGRYRGVRNEPGHDGLWRAPDGHDIVVEVKTTDAYRISIETIANYRRHLIRKDAINDERSSVLIVVGRQDTGELEEQVRGSRFAWDTRLIGVEALLRLAATREALDDPSTSGRIAAILKPREYTRLDHIVELVFQAAQDAEQIEFEDVTGPGEAEPVRVSYASAAEMRAAAIVRLERHFSTKFAKQTRTGYLSGDEKIAIVCKPSKRYARGRGDWYWFTFLETYREFLNGAARGFICFVCGSADRMLLIPREDLFSLLPKMRSTDGRYQIEIDWQDGDVRLDWPAVPLMAFVLTSR
jgi:hypothetical protein